MRKRHCVQIGDVFGNLTVVRENGRDRHGHLFYECLCACGKTARVRKGHLVQKRIKSCGCAWLSSLSTHARSRRKAYGESSCNTLYNHYRTSARRRGIPFGITRTEFSALCVQPCVYCGDAPSQVFKGKGSYGEFVYNGVDRTDNTLGYTPENSVPCCCICNRAKCDLDANTFRAWIERLLEIGVPNGLRSRGLLIENQPC